MDKLETVQQIPHNRDCLKCSACEQVGRWKAQAEVESLRQQSADSQARESALIIALKQQLFSTSPKIDYCKDSKVDDWKCYYRDEIVPELQAQLAETHKLWQESCSDAFEKSKQLTQAREALKRIKDLSSDGQEDCHCPESYNTATKALAGKE